MSDVGIFRQPSASSLRVARLVSDQNRNLRLGSSCQYDVAIYQQLLQLNLNDLAFDCAFIG